MGAASPWPWSTVTVTEPLACTDGAASTPFEIYSGDEPLTDTAMEGGSSGPARPCPSRPPGAPRRRRPLSRWPPRELSQRRSAEGEQPIARGCRPGKRRGPQDRQRVRYHGRGAWGQEPHAGGADRPCPSAGATEEPVTRADPVACAPDGLAELSAAVPAPEMTAAPVASKAAPDAAVAPLRYRPAGGRHPSANRE